MTYLPGKKIILCKTAALLRASASANMFQSDSSSSPTLVAQAMPPQQAAPSVLQRWLGVGSAAPSPPAQQQQPSAQRTSLPSASGSRVPFLKQFFERLSLSPVTQESVAAAAAETAIAATRSMHKAVSDAQQSQLSSTNDQNNDQQQVYCTSELVAEIERQRNRAEMAEAALTRVQAALSERDAQIAQEQQLIQEYKEQIRLAALEKDKLASELSDLQNSFSDSAPAAATLSAGEPSLVGQQIDYDTKIQELIAEIDSVKSCLASACDEAEKLNETLAAALAERNTQLADTEHMLQTALERISVLEMERNMLKFHRKIPSSESVFASAAPALPHHEG